MWHQQNWNSSSFSIHYVCFSEDLSDSEPLVLFSNSVWFNIPNDSVSNIDKTSELPRKDVLLCLILESFIKS